MKYLLMMFLLASIPETHAIFGGDDFDERVKARLEALREIDLQMNGPEIGKIYEGKVVTIKEYGAFVDLIPNVSGLLHISEMGHERIRSVEEYLSMGDTIRVSFSISTVKKIRCEAVVVRISEPQGRYPRGMGIRFIEMDKRHEKSFENFLNSPDGAH